MIARLRANPNQVTIKVHYQDLDGKSIPGLSDTAISGNIGDAYKIPTPKASGYTYEKTTVPLDGTFSSDQSAVIAYENYNGTIIIHYLDESENKIHDDFTYTGDMSSEDYNKKANEAYLQEIIFEGKTYEIDQSNVKQNHNGRTFETFVPYKLKQ